MGVAFGSAGSGTEETEELQVAGSLQASSYTTFQLTGKLLQVGRRGDLWRAMTMMLSSAYLSRGCLNLCSDVDHCLSWP